MLFAEFGGPAGAQLPAALQLPLFGIATVPPAPIQDQVCPHTVAEAASRHDSVAVVSHRSAVKEDAECRASAVGREENLHVREFIVNRGLRIARWLTLIAGLTPR